MKEKGQGSPEGAFPSQSNTQSKEQGSYRKEIAANALLAPPMEDRPHEEVVKGFKEIAGINNKQTPQKGHKEKREDHTKTFIEDTSQTRDTATYGNKVEHWRIQIAPLPIMRFFRSGMSSEAYVELENSICREIIEGSARLGISEAEYIQRIGISRSFSHRPGKKRGVRL